MNCARRASNMPRESPGVMFSMRAARLLAAWTVLLCCASRGVAWNATGHRIIAAIAYQRLSPGTRMRVDEMIRRHPDYAVLFTRDAPADTEGRARAAFIAAAVWPDAIKGDPRFWDDTRLDARPTPLLSGFRDMARHTNWHYIDIPYTPDGAPGVQPGEPNALSALRRLLGEIGGPDTYYDLPWVEHLVGDIHQPLHCVTRFLKSQLLNPQPEGDAGGNAVFVSPGRNLHALWDDLAGNDTSDSYVSRLAAELTAENPPPWQGGEDPEQWVEEGVNIARNDVYAFGVYTFGLEMGSRDHPVELSQSYLDHARRVARKRIALSGYRLAATLNDKLK
jgi:hypothetical protein